MLVFERFRLKKLLGRGGMGVVWLARDEELEIDIALKFLSETLINDSSALRDLKKETRRGMQLAHPNIIRVFGFYSGDIGAAVAMEYVEGNTLSSLRDPRENDAFEVDEIQGWTVEVCSALHYAHTQVEIVHRDLKPANLMIDFRNRLKVADFGIASSLTDAHTRITGAAGPRGTLAYMSPQQQLGQRACVSHDVYSLGATLYDLLTGKPPFYTGEISLQIRETVAPSISERRAELGFFGTEIPTEWEETIAACLAKDASQRPASAAEVVERLSLESFDPSTIAGFSHPIPSRLSSMPPSEPTVYVSGGATQADHAAPSPAAAGPSSETQAAHITGGFGVAGANRWSGPIIVLIVLASVIVGGGLAFFAMTKTPLGSGTVIPLPPVSDSSAFAPLPANTAQTTPEPSTSNGGSATRPSSIPGAPRTTTNPGSRLGPPPMLSKSGSGPDGRDGIQGPRVPDEMLAAPKLGYDFTLEQEGLVFSWIPPNSTRLGAPSFETRVPDYEKPITQATFSEGFWIGRTEVTQKQYEALMGNNPSYFSRGGQFPVESVSWFDAMKFCAVLNKRYADELPPGYTFSLPTAFQFEVSAISAVPGIFGEINGKVGSHSWGQVDNVLEPQAVGLLDPTPWELYDIYGNVEEWTLDWFTPSLPGGQVSDWAGPETGTQRVVKGGSIRQSNFDLRSFGRKGLDPAEHKPLVGFRVALIPFNAQNLPSFD